MSASHRTFAVRAMGSTDAVASALAEARAQGFRIRTLARVHQVEPHVRDNRREVLAWEVTVVVVKP